MYIEILEIISIAALGQSFVMYCNKVVCVGIPVSVTTEYIQTLVTRF